MVASRVLSITWVPGGCCSSGAGGQRATSPPGPPLRRSVPQVEATRLIASLAKLGESHGPVSGVRSGYRLLKEAPSDRAEEFAGRGDFPAEPRQRYRLRDRGALAAASARASAAQRS